MTGPTERASDRLSTESALQDFDEERRLCHSLALQPKRLNRRFMPGEQSFTIHRRLA